MSKISKYICLSVFIVALAFVMVLGICTSSIANAADNGSVTYSNVIEDLRKDKNFNLEDYPSILDNNGLQVISIAESVAGELFIYIYHPSQKLRDTCATSINISTAIGDNLNYKNYKLTRVSKQLVFSKYKVENFTVKSDTIRYYDISAVFRAWQKEIDTQPGNDNETTEVSYAVGKLFTACTLNGEVSYSCTETETIVITDKYCGYVRYNNGFVLYQNKCDSWYVAFSTDREIDSLKEADVYYISKPCEKTVSLFGTKYQYGDITENYAYLKYDQETSNPADGLFGKKYTWKRIESVNDFISNEDLTDETKSALNNKQWVLRFAETEYKSVTNVNGITYQTSTVVSDVTILRLKFETDGVVYNLGVVDNKQSADWTTPDNNNTNELDLPDRPDKKPILEIILAIIAGLLIVLLIVQIIKLFGRRTVVKVKSNNGKGAKKRGKND